MTHAFYFIGGFLTAIVVLTVVANVLDGVFCRKAEADFRKDCEKYAAAARKTRMRKAGKEAER